MKRDGFWARLLAPHEWGRRHLGGKWELWPMNFGCPRWQPVPTWSRHHEPTPKGSWGAYPLAREDHGAAPRSEVPRSA